MNVLCPRCKTEHELAEAEILSMAARIWNRRRKTHAGFACKIHNCRWCGQPCEGREALRLHQRDCSKSLAAVLGLEAFRE